MNRCAQCQTENRPERRFCGNCGAQLEIVCPGCQFSNELSARYCGGCGKELHAVSREAGSGAALAGGVAPGSAERRQLTIMFCDVVDSTLLATRLDPEELSAINRDYQQLATSIIEQHGGYVARYMGDGILAYFGYPSAHENDAERSIYAGLELLERVPLCGSETIDIAIRIGIATGAVVVGELIGDGSSREHAAVGSAPNLAARVQGAAPPGVLAVTDLTRRLAGDLFAYESLGDQSLKGFDEPICLFRVIGKTASTSRFVASQQGQQLSSLVGREHETDLLERLWLRTQSGDGQFALLCGEAGIGKSRLLQFAFGLAEPAQASTVCFQCSPYHQHHALYPVIQYLRAAVLVEESDSSKAIEKKLQGFLSETEVDTPRAAPILAGLLDTATTKTTSENPEPQQQKEHTMQVLLALLKSFTVVRPLLIIFEDLHWVDPTTKDLLSRIVYLAPALPVLVVATSRPGFAAPWMDSPHAHRVNLNRLAAEQSRSLVRQIAGKPLPETILEQIVDKTDGVPLFLEELTRTVLNGEWLLEGAEGYRLSADKVEFTIPETLQDSLMERLDSLGDARACALGAAVIGREFEIGMLAAVLRKTVGEVGSDLQQLVGSGLMYRSPNTGVLEKQAIYVFKHALIQDAAYESLLKSRRKAMHHRLATYLTTQRRGYAQRQPDLLAHHYHEAGDFLQAARYWHQAGKQAMQQSAQREAISHLETALDVLLRTTGNRQRDQLELSMRIDLAACHRLTDEYDKALHCLAGAKRLADRLQDSDALSDIHYMHGNICFPIGDVECCLEQHNLSLMHARRSGSAEKEAQAIGGLGDAYYLRRQMRSAAARFAECCKFAREHQFHSLDAANRSMIGWSRIHLFELADALQDAKKAATLAQQCKIHRAEMMARSLACYVLGLMGNSDEARAEGDAACELAKKIGTSNLEAAILYFLAEGVDSTTEQRELLEKALATSRAHGITFHGPAILGALSLITAESSKREALWAEAERVLAAGCVGHNYFWFARHAIDSALKYGDLRAAVRFGGALSENVAVEPVPWSRFYAEYARLLAAARKEPHDSIKKKLLGLQQQAASAGLASAELNISQALTR